MELLPSVETRKWLGSYLRKLIQRCGWETFALAPIVLPTDAFFPVGWSARAVDVHRLTQHLMHYAELDHLRFSLKGSPEGHMPGKTFDKETAAIFAGIEEGRGLFDVDIFQFRDPAEAVGVMAHVVAHAWRSEHRLMTDAEDREELLTDVTTVYLGFGVLTTNNTDRVRWRGSPRYREWSVSNSGYLPPASMAWLLALQACARAREDEIRGIEQHLEPVQKQSFRAALKEIENDPEHLNALHLPDRDFWPKARPIEPVELREPQSDEIIEPPKVEIPSSERNRGKTIYLESGTSFISLMYLGVLPGFLVGAFLSLGTRAISDHWSMVFPMVLVPAVLTLWVWRRYRFVCSDQSCTKVLRHETAICPGCGGTNGGRISNRELRRLRQEEYERQDNLITYEECDECEPEAPCARHRVTDPFDPPSGARREP